MRAPEMDPTESLAPEGAVRKRVTQPGEGEVAGRGSRVTLLYTLHLESSSSQDATPLDSSARRPGGMLTFTLGKGKVIPALELAAASMRQGEQCEVISNAAYAFGGKGLKRKGIPPGASVVLNVEMVNFESGECIKSIAQMSSWERMAQAQSSKEIGNMLFREAKYEKAMAEYSKSIRFLSQVFYKPNGNVAAVNAYREDASAANGDEGERKANGGQQKEEAGVDSSASNGPSNADEDGFQEAEIIDLTQPRSIVSLSALAEHPPANISESVNTHQEQSSGDTERSKEADSQNKNASGTEAQGEAMSTPDDPSEDEVVRLHVTTLNNLALCCIKVGDYKSAEEGASLAAKMDPRNHKALYYRGRARVALGNWDEARADFVAAAKLQPRNMGIRGELEKLDKKLKQHKAKEKKQAAAMFA